MVINVKLLYATDRRRKRSGSLTGLLRRRRSSSGLKDPAQDSIDLNKLYGARIKRRRKSGQNEDEGFVLGLGLFTYEQKEANVLREREIYFEHPSVEVCTKWSAQLNRFIDCEYKHSSFLVGLTTESRGVFCIYPSQDRRVKIVCHSTSLSLI